MRVAAHKRFIWAVTKYQGARSCCALGLVTAMSLKAVAGGRADENTGGQPGKRLCLQRFALAARSACTAWSCSNGTPT